MGESDDDSSGSNGGNGDVYRGRAESVLVSLLDSYSEDDEILGCDSRYSSYPAYTFTDYLVYQLLP